MFNVSNYHWHTGHISESCCSNTANARAGPKSRACALSGEGRFRTDVLPLRNPSLMILSRSTLGLSSDNPVRSVTLTWISLLYLNNGDFVHAAEAGRRSEQMFRCAQHSLSSCREPRATRREESGSQSHRSASGRWPNLDLWLYADVTIPRRCGRCAQRPTIFTASTVSMRMQSMLAARAGVTPTGSVPP